MARRRWWATMRFRTTAVASVVVLVALSVGGVGLVLVVRGHLVAADRSAARLRADDVLALAGAGAVPRSLSFPGEEDGATQLLGRDGKVVAATDNLEHEKPISGLRPEPDEHSSEIRHIDALDEDHRYVVVAVTSEDGRYTVLAAVSLQPSEETVATLTRALLVGLPLLVGVVALTTRLLVVRALRPVAAITAEVSDITDRELERRVPEPDTNDEIAELAVTMNHMLERLETASVRQRRFVADASHELRSPLASARTVLEVAALHPGSRADLLAAIGDALVDHDRLDRLTLDLLELAKLDEHRLVLTATDMDVDAFVQDLVARRGEGAIEVTSQVGTLRLSEQVLTRVLTNLLDNAARYRSARTTVRLGVTHATLTVVVEDDGPGIPPAERERIFLPFTRLDQARVADSGTGLGLAIVRELLDAVGGRIHVESSEWGGARFVVTIPLVAPGRGRERQMTTEVEQ